MCDFRLFGADHSVQTDTSVLREGAGSNRERERERGKTTRTPLEQQRKANGERERERHREGGERERESARKRQMDCIGYGGRVPVEFLICLEALAGTERGTK